MATIKVTVCDVCRNPGRQTTQFHIVEEGKGFTVDLCDAHATPLRELLKQGVTGRAPRKAAVRKAPTRRKRAGFDAAVSTIDEIEVRKQG